MRRQDAADEPDAGEAAASTNEMTGGFEIASLQVNFNDLPMDVAERSMRLFAEQVIPQVRAANA